MHPKTAATGIGAALATIIIYAASLAGVTVPGEVGAAIAAVIAFAASYLKGAPQA